MEYKNDTSKELKENITILEKHKEEVDEACCIAEEMKERVNDILESLSRWDFVPVCSGGIFHIDGKYSKACDVDIKTKKLEERFRKFEKELMDITNEIEFSAIVNDFLFFTECYFSNSFSKGSILPELENKIKIIVELSERLNELKEEIKDKIVRK